MRDPYTNTDPTLTVMTLIDQLPTFQWCFISTQFPVEVALFEYSDNCHGLDFDKGKNTWQQQQNVEH